MRLIAFEGVDRCLSRRTSTEHGPRLPSTRMEPPQEPTAEDEIQLISDGDGLAVIGEPTAVERFVVAEGLPSTDLGLPRLRSVLGNEAAAAQAGSEIAANSGRWVKLTKESAPFVEKYGLTESKTRGVRQAMVGKPGAIKKWLQIERGPGILLTNPAHLASAAGIMAQVAMQQAMDEITDYLAAIDEKVDDVLRAQKNTVLADMIGVNLVIDEAMTIRGKVGRVSEVTWSKVQARSATITRTQAYALGRTSAVTSSAETADGPDRRWTGSSCSTSHRYRSPATDTEEPRSPIPGSSPTTPNDRNRGEPEAERSARRVRRAAGGNGPRAIPEPRPRPTRPCRSGMKAGVTAHAPGSPRR